MANPRALALETLVRVEKERAYANKLVDHTLNQEELSPEDRRLYTQLVYGALRQRAVLDWNLDALLPKPLSKQDLILRNLLRLGAYQCLYLDRIPSRAAVDTSVNLAKKRLPRLSGLVNAVLRNLLRQGPREIPTLESDPITHISVAGSHPRWMVEAWVKRFGAQEALALAQANNETPPVVLRVNTLKATPGDVLQRLRETGYEAEPSTLVPEGIILGASLPQGVRALPGWEEGEFTVQDQASMLVAYALSPEPGWQVVDLCSAPGGKTTHLAQIMKDQGEILALDLYPQRLEKVGEVCRRLGIRSVKTLAQDAREPLPGSPLAQAVLLDAPCMGLGVLNRRVDARWQKQPEQLQELVRLQSQLLDAASSLVQPGGILVYSTCSIEPQENQEQILGFLNRHPDFTLEPLIEVLPGPVREWIHEPWVELLPHRHGTDGFFIARMKRKGI